MTFCEPHDAPVTLKEALWLHFDVEFGSLFGPFSRRVHVHVVFAQNAPRAHENAFLEVPGSQNPSFLWTIFDSIFDAVLGSLQDVLLEQFMPPRCSKGKILDPLWAPMGSQMAPKAHPRAQNDAQKVVAQLPFCTPGADWCPKPPQGTQYLIFIDFGSSYAPPSFIFVRVRHAMSRTCQEPAENLPRTCQEPAET